MGTRMSQSRHGEVRVRTRAWGAAWLQVAGERCNVRLQHPDPVLRAAPQVLGPLLAAEVGALMHMAGGEEHMEGHRQEGQVAQQLEAQDLLGRLLQQVLKGGSVEVST